MHLGTQRTYDPAGNVWGVSTTLPSGVDSQQYCYDAFNRLVSATSANGVPSCGDALPASTLTAAQYSQSFSYDTLDRLSSITSSGAAGAAPGAYTYGNSAHLHAATATAGGYTATYDAAGNMTCRAPTSSTTCSGSTPTGAQLFYDAERRLTQSQSAPSNPSTAAWYLYDGEGHRVERSVQHGATTATTYYLLGGLEEVHTDGTTTQTTSYTKYYPSGLSLNTSSDASGSGIRYLASDGLGSVQTAFDASEVVVSSQPYSP